MITKTPTIKSWEVVELQDVACVESGGNAPQGDIYFKGGKYPFIRVQHFDGSKVYIDKFDLINDEAIKKYRLKKFEKNSIVFPKSGASINLEKRAMLPMDAYVVGHLCVVRPKQIDEKFLYYILKSEKFATSGNGSTLPFLNISHIKKRKLFITNNLDEQKSIACMLTTVQEAIAGQEKLITKFKELKHGMMQQLFTHGTKGEQTKTTKIGEVPESWDVVEFQNMVEFSKKPRGLSLSGSIPFVPMDMIYLDKMFITNYKLRKAVASGTFVINGDILLAKITPSFENGKQGIIKIDSEYAYATTEVIPFHEIVDVSNKLFIYYWLKKDDVRKDLAGKMEGSTGRQRLNKSVLDKKLMPRPSVAEQNEIASAFYTIDQKIEVAQEKLSAYQNLFKTLLHKLMSGERRVSFKYGN